MKSFIFILFGVCLLLSAVNEKYHLSKSTNVIFQYTILLCLIISAGFRDGFAGYRDYSEYVDLYYNYDDNIEIGFNIIRSFALWLDSGNYYILFLIYAILGVSLKYMAIRKLGNLVYFSLAIYISYFFSLHELTQIRVGVASAICLISVKAIYDRNIVRFLMLIVGASLFHQSSLIFLPMYILSPTQFRIKYWLIVILLILLLTYTFSFDWINLIQLIPSERAVAKLMGYNEMFLNGTYEEAKLFGLFELMNYVLILIFICFRSYFISVNKYFYLLLKVFIIGILIKIVFAKIIPVLSGRGYELCAITLIILIPMLALNKYRFIGVIVAVLVAFAYMYSQFFLQELIP